MHEDQIVARAQREVIERRTGEVRQRWHGSRGWLPIILVISVVVGFLAFPMPLPQKLFLAMGGACSLRPSHSFFAGDLQFPLESRMMGIYGGFMLTLGWFLLARRADSRHLGSKRAIGLLLLMFLTMVFDGINSTFAELALPHLYTPTNAVRLVTGLLSGIALAPLVVWLLGLIALPSMTVRRRPVIGSLWDLLVPLTVSAVFAVLVTGGGAWSYYPLAFITVAGIVAALASAVLLAILLVSGLEGRVRQVSQLIAPGAVALLVAFAVLGGAALLRWNAPGDVDPIGGARRAMPASIAGS